MPNAFGPRCDNCGATVEPTVGGAFVFTGAETRNVGPAPADCPYCGEQVEIYVEPDVRGSFVQDCEVCCNPWRIRVVRDGDDRHVEVRRADGSE